MRTQNILLDKHIQKIIDSFKKFNDNAGYCSVENVGQIAPPPSIQTSGGKQKLNCANTEGLFRIIQSIPSPRVEPLKRWLARMGKERIDEIENPELAMARMQELYEKKGYPKAWIDKRLRGIAVRQDLTDEWKNRGARTTLEYAILTMLGEATTTELHRDRDSQGFDPLKKYAQDGGAVAGRTRKDIETQTGKPVVTGENFKQLAGK